jgi:hypothetical protein
VPRLDNAIEIGVALADEADARGAASGGLPGSALVLITGSVITAGDARLLLTRAGLGEPDPGRAWADRPVVDDAAVDDAAADDARADDAAGPWAG